MGKPYHIKSITEYHNLLGIPKPKHPLIGLINHEDIQYYDDEKLINKTYEFYTISRKINFAGTMKYGQHYYDFQEGVMVFHGPKQVIISELTDDAKLKGWTLLIHPDFIRTYSLAEKIKQFGFFSYSMNEALHLSEEEADTIEEVMDTIRKEYNSGIDNYSQDILTLQVELLLNYCNRFYNRQFITRKLANSDLLVKFEKLLSDYFESGELALNGIPSVHHFSNELNMSANYLSDMLRSLTGQSTQQHIHDKLIDKAKEILTTTNLTVGEIAYDLGFEYPQSFSKLFKSKTNLTPLEYRQSFN
ncbi:Transcriptional regulator [uncultured Dysgonomonas sp.]|uniref:Transcriptional regulator n=1 Tax=uncultured Dysgonomonas sp. TaxID=206096 RepID=A0A212IVB1_9BACT|nr:helix-turn-helix transcriptional regulator [Bacteroides thetaiotaomicron]MDC2215956.1 helix-turn-helix transcriptional regulator [Bacteroides thetaiotaomicron]SBV91146.1 Transcriptional regulator [uncultured Dysgonomonas sp.]